jgi:hypothetical protein
MTDDIDVRITPALHPDNVKQIEGYEDGDIAAVLAPTMTAFSEAYEGVRSTLTAREAAKRNPTWNEAQQIIQTDDYAQRQFARIAKGFDMTRANLERGITSIEAELAKPVESKAAHTVATEIRGFVRGLDTGERMTLVQRAIDEGDHITATAILGAPAYLSGFDPKMQAVLLRQYHERHNPQMSKRLKAMQGAKDLIERNGPLLHEQLEKAVGAPPHKARALREAKTAAEKAFVLKDLA